VPPGRLPIIMRTYRSDAELEQLLDEPGNWVVKDIIGSPVAHCDCLRDAIRVASGLRSSSASLPPDGIEVFSAQIQRLAQRMGHGSGAS